MSGQITSIKKLNKFSFKSRKKYLIRIFMQRKELNLITRWLIEWK